MNLLQRIGDGLFRAALAAIALVVATYGADWSAYRLEGSPQSTVTIHRMVVVPLKNNKLEYDYVGTFDEPCSVSLFPQGGLSPCLRDTGYRDLNHGRRMKFLLVFIQPSNLGITMFSRSQNENGSLNSRCLYCFITIASNVETETELHVVEARHVCPEKALTELLTLKRTALIQLPKKQR
jgi:hypothetical protein